MMRSPSVQKSKLPCTSTFPFPSVFVGKLFFKEYILQIVMLAIVSVRA